MNSPKVACKRGKVDLRVGQLWSLRIEAGSVFFVNMRIVSLDDETVSMEALEVEKQGTPWANFQHDCSWSQALAKKFARIGKLYHAHVRWDVWKDMMPSGGGV